MNEKKALLEKLDWLIRGLLALITILFIYETDGYLDMKSNPEIGVSEDAMPSLLFCVLMSMLIGSINWYFVVKRNSTFAAAMLFMGFAALVLLGFSQMEVADIQKYKTIDYASDIVAFILLAVQMYSWSICYAIKSGVSLDQSSNQASAKSPNYSSSTNDPKKKLETSLDELEKLHILKTRGIITDEEYDMEKKKILKP